MSNEKTPLSPCLGGRAMSRIPKSGKIFNATEGISGKIFNATEEFYTFVSVSHKIAIILDRDKCRYTL